MIFFLTFGIILTRKSIKNEIKLRMGNLVGTGERNRQEINGLQ